MSTDNATARMYREYDTNGEVYSLFSIIGYGDAIGKSEQVDLTNENRGGNKEEVGKNSVTHSMCAAVCSQRQIYIGFQLNNYSLR